MEIHWKFISNPIQISVKYKWKSIGNPNGYLFEIKLEFNEKCKSIGNPVEISLKYQWKSIGNPVDISMKFQ